MLSSAPVVSGLPLRAANDVPQPDSTPPWAIAIDGGITAAYTTPE